MLAMRPHGESAAIIEILTADKGRHAGVVRGGGGRRLAPVLMPGNQLAVSWRARLEGQLGHFAVEPLRAHAAGLLDNARALAGLSAICALLTRALPEREPQPGLYPATVTLIEALGQVQDWPVLYLQWELGLLTTLGFGLDLSRCARSGANDGLAFVSPRTGRAVTAAAAEGWEDRLLPLPRCLLNPGPPGPGEIAAGLRLTGHFLHRALSPGPDPRPLPEARLRLAKLLAGA